MTYQLSVLSASPGLIGLCPLPGRLSPLAHDLAIIQAWRPTLVVSLMEPAEMARHGADSLGVRLAESGMDWEAFPIPDFGVPADHATARWLELSRRLHLILDQGERVLVHCLGGQGRSGMVAMRLLVERGEPPEAALRRLRAIRARAVETDAQYAWAAAAETPGGSAAPDSG